LLDAKSESRDWDCLAMSVRIIQGDVRDILLTLPSNYFDCICTSPPYFGLRSYLPDSHHDKHLEIGLEPTLNAYLETMVGVCRELRRVLKPSGVFFLNIGDSYATGGYSKPHTGLAAAAEDADGNHRGKSGPRAQYDTVIRARSDAKPKDLCLVPERLGILLQADGWFVRSHIIWSKKNPMPESVTDRPTSAHETIWMLAKSERYFYDVNAVREPQQTLGERHEGKSGYREGHPSKGGILERKLHPDGANIRNVWHVASHPFPGAHFATMPPEIAERCIKAGSPRGGRILDPFAGSGTIGLVADRLGRDCTLIDLNTSYAEMALNRIRDDCPMFTEVAAG